MGEGALLSVKVIYCIKTEVNVDYGDIILIVDKKNAID